MNIRRPPLFIPVAFLTINLSKGRLLERGTVLSYRIDRTEGIVLVDGPDPSTPTELANFFAALIQDPQFHVGDGFLRDRRGLAAPEADLLHAVMATMAAVPQLHRSRFAVIVAPEDQANFGMMRMAQIVGGGVPFEIAIFSNETDARRWLRATPPMSHVVLPHIKHESEVRDRGDDRRGGS